MGTPQDPQDPPFPFPAPFPIPDPDAPPDPDTDEPKPDPRPSLTRDPRIDPQQGDEVRAGDEVRQIIGRDDDIVRCIDGVMRYRIKLSRWQKWCHDNNVIVTKNADQEL